MKPEFLNPTLFLYPKGDPRRRLFALWYFTVLMIVWNILGHTVLGFEQAPAAPLIGIGAALAASLLLELVNAHATGRRLRFVGSWFRFLNFLPPSLIPGFACGMLLFPNDRWEPIAFAAVLSIASKVLLRAPLGNGHSQHFFNPSNLGIAATLLLFPQVGFAPPYHFTQNLTGWMLWALPLFILATGIFVHGKFTGMLPLCIAWVGGFVLQGVVRANIAGVPWYVPLAPMTSAAFIVFTLYMVPDPATTPLHTGRQVLFGASVAIAYGILQLMHVVFGLFFALISVCAIRGVSLWIAHFWRKAPTGGSSFPVGGVALNPSALPQPPNT